MQTITAILGSPWFLVAWGLITLPCIAVVIRDLAMRNAHLMSLMKVVWVLTVAYSGPLGLAVYWWTGRKEIASDGIWRRGFRSVAHCYSGCGMGEIVGLMIAVGIFAAGNATTAAVTFSLAYLFGIVLTVGPTMQEGVGFGTALKDALIAETPSIATMEAVAIGSDIYLAGNATMGDPIFWASLVVSLTLGRLADYPVNVLLIRLGIKEGMMDPRMTDR